MSNDLKQISTSDCRDSSLVGSENGVKEKAIIFERPNSCLVGVVFVDESDAISGGLVESVKHKAFLLASSYLLEPEFGVSEPRKLQGQVGLIRLERLPNSPDQKRSRTTESAPMMAPSFRRYTVEPTTARHNIINQQFGSAEEGYRMGTYQSSTMVSSGGGEFVLEFPDGGEFSPSTVVVRKENEDENLDPIAWNMVDTTKANAIGSVQNRHTLTKATYSFGKAESYTLAPGHKIAIVVYRFWDIPAKDAMFTGTEAQWEGKREELFGGKFTPCIYTGEIVRVSDDGRTFEHNINTFKGCSGAIVFLLDKNQPDDIAMHTAVGQRLFGAAIGVHVGAPTDEITGSNVNIGFKLP